MEEEFNYFPWLEDRGQVFINISNFHSCFSAIKKGVLRGSTSKKWLKKANIGFMLEMSQLDGNNEKSNHK